MKEVFVFRKFKRLATDGFLGVRGFAFFHLVFAISSGCVAAPQSRDECRASQVQGDVVSCIERGLYDPCDDAGGGWGRSQCAWAWAEIADRRVMKAEHEILSRLRSGKADLSVFNRFRQSQKDWNAYRDSHCSFTNATVDLEQFTGTSSSHSGFCRRRLTEQRALELEAIVAKRE
jgi:uncharacterized protein YecT (DUF1311 family)